MNPQLANKGFRVALGSFVVAGTLLILVLATLSTSWGVAYGQTAGPSTTAATTTQVSGTQPSAVENSNTSPTTAPSAVNDANQAPVGVVPGLPHTGTQTSTSDDGWKYGVLALLALNMVVAAIVMFRSSKSAAKRR